MLNIFPLSAACVERLVSRIKTNLIKVDKVDKNVPEKLSQVRLDQLLRIGTESPKDGYNNNVYEHFVDKLQKRNPNMHIEL